MVKPSGPIRNIRVRGYVSAASFVGTAVVCALLGAWVFQERAAPQDASVWRLVVSDRWTLGFLRVAIIAAGIYAAASAAALIATGRWVRSLSKSGLEVDEPDIVDEGIEEVRAQLRDTKEERDRAYQLLREYLGG